MARQFVKLSLVDVTRLSEFLQKQSVETKRFFHPFLFDVTSVTAALSDDDMLLYAFEVDGDIAVVWLLRDIDTDILEYGVVVDEESRRRSYGLLATRLALDTTRQLNKQGLWLSVYSENVLARKLYEKVGFKTTGVMADGQIRMEWLA